MIHEVAVMADEQHRAPVGVQVVLQPGDGLQVKMVGRLVQQEQIRLGQQHPAQAQPGALAAGEQRGQLPLLLLAEAQARQHPLHRGTPAVAVGPLEVPRQLIVLAAQAAQERLVVAHVSHLLFQGAQLPLHFHHRLKDALQLLQHRAALAHLALLGKIPQLQALLHGDGAAVGCFQPGDNLHQRGLAAAVDAHQAHALAVLQNQGRVPQHLVGAEAFLNALQG